MRPKTKPNTIPIENLLAMEWLIAVRSIDPPRIISITISERTMHRISVNAASRLRIVEHLSLTPILEAKEITTILLLPPKIVPNSTEYVRGASGITIDAISMVTARTLDAKPAIARMAALGLPEKTRYMFIFMPPSNRMKTTASAAR
ncbi:hypothetical protein A3K79_03855 [Candidatus Bathyarchaeota archaeon RBG_13_46_16b]|nr:MAG: hypothetical protein A3K79_03855 [Candidatus Bathyarchaeota archaeon RBG_13_46_16b]